MQTGANPKHGLIDLLPAPGLVQDGAWKRMNGGRGPREPRKVGFGASEAMSSPPDRQTRKSGVQRVEAPENRGGFGGGGARPPQGGQAFVLRIIQGQDLP